MKFSLKWLGEFIDTSSFFKEPQLLSDRLTQAGLEIDAIENQKQQYDKMVLAQIESVTKHPQADRLTLCQVKTDQKTYSIVCGAQNHKAGDKVILTQPGAKLTNGSNKGLKIKKSKIRGIESEGMLASKSELGFPEEEGIWILPESAPLGQSFSQYFGLDDILFEISVPPNRSDCLSHKGLAREMACLFSLKLKESQPKPTTTSSQLSLLSSLSVKVQDSTACPRYCAGLIQGVQVKASPDWLKNRLKSIGLKSINNVVDITNFILWDQGQPLHAFDRDKIQSIQVEMAQQGEEFLSLDDTVLKLQAGDLLIKDKNEILALAGIIGAKASSISPQTQNIVIESAYFAPQKIRKTARSLGLETDSSYRFTRGVDPSHVFSALKLACSLIQQVAGGTVAKDFYDIYPNPKKSEPIFISVKEVSQRLGYEVSAEEFKKQMSSLACDIQTKEQGSTVTTPSYRSDLHIKEDLIEEFARLSAYDKIPETLPPSLPPKDSHKDFINSQKLIDFLSSNSWSQSLNYSFCDPVYFKEFTGKIAYLEDLLNPNKASKNPQSNNSKNPQLDNSKNPQSSNLKNPQLDNSSQTSHFLKHRHSRESGNPSLDTKNSFSVKNPISQTLSLMKTLLTPDLFKNILYNYRRNNKAGQLFELSPVFYQSQQGYQQEWNLALATWGQAPDLWKPQNPPNFYKIKNFIESLLQAFQISARWDKFSEEDSQKFPIPFLHPKQSLILKYKKQKVGYMGSLHPKYGSQYKIQSDVALAEISADVLLKNTKSLKFKAFSQLSTVEKDLCFEVPLKISAGEVAQEIKKTLNCKKVEIFDIYQKDLKRFVSFRMHLEPKEKSWTDPELQSFLTQAIQAVQNKFNIHLKP